MTEKSLMQDGDIYKEEEELIFNPYNERNKEITESEVCDILKKYGVPDKVHNINLYKRSFVHKSYCKRPKLENEENGVIIVDQPTNCMRLRTKSNERLEFLGDGVLELITKYYLYRRFPKENEGFMTEKKIALVKNESIGRMAYEMGLNKWYVISANAEEKKTRTNLKKLGCLFESFLGALFLDFNKIDIHDDDKWFDNVFVTGPGFQIAQIFVESIFDNHVNWTELIQNDDNYKNILQVMLQKAFQVTPIYREVSGWDENEGYHMGVYLGINVKAHEFEPSDSNILKIEIFANNNKPLDNVKQLLEDNPGKQMVILLSRDKHKIKKKAEQSACKMAIDKLS
jgi:dsRNA-specific ribonuclease|tara:strand:+ start:14 stop:1039 length:1026 start_codon:yes stop_codon:yes gene_type:complete